MLFKNLLRSSKLEIITSKRLTALIYLITGLAILLWWSMVLWQFFYAYVVYEEFDVSVSDFIVITTVFLFPLFLIGCWMLTGVIKRQRILYWIKHSLVVNNYQTLLGPATAGFLIDYEYNVAEVWGTLLKLHFQGNIEIKSHIKSLEISYIHNDNLGSYENLLLEQIFLGHREIEIQNLRDSTFVNAGLHAHKRLVIDLLQSGAFELKNTITKTTRRLIKIIYGLAGMATLLQIIGIWIGGSDRYWGINYPRYEVSIIEPILLIVITMIGLVIIFSGFWFQLKNDFKSRPSMLLLQSSGFYAYLKNVYGQRMSEEHLQTQAVSDIKSLTPFILAYKLQPLTISYLRKVLDCTSQN